MQRFRKKLRRQGAQILRNEEYLSVLRNNEGCSATQHVDFLQNRQACSFQQLHGIMKPGIQEVGHIQTDKQNKNEVQDNRQMRHLHRLLI